MCVCVCDFFSFSKKAKKDINISSHLRETSYFRAQHWTCFCISKVVRFRQLYIYPHRKISLFTFLLNVQNPINHAKIKILKVEDDQLYSKCSIFKYSISCSPTRLFNIEKLILEKCFVIAQLLMELTLWM